MSLIGATILCLLVDIPYGYARATRFFPTYGSRGRFFEAVALTSVVMIWGWELAPRLLTPFWAGVGGLFIYGLVYLAGSVVLYLTGRLILAPIGVGSILFAIFCPVLLFVGTSFAGPANGGVPDSLSLPLIGVMAGCYFIGTYLTGGILDEFRKLDRESQSTSADVALSQAGAPPHDHEDQHNPETVPESTSRSTSSRSELANQSKTTSRKQNEFDGHSYDWDYSSTAFSDIGGYYTVKDELHSGVVEPIQAVGGGDDRFSRFGVEPARGIMFYGPPGTGKTMFARALAGELNVPFVELSASDVTSRWINASSEQIKILFDEAVTLGQCVIFLDEAEHLFGARDVSDLSSHVEDRKVTSEFLAQLSREDREAIVVSATNRPGDIDPAILRPGRLSTHFEVGLPDEEARHAILNVHLDDVPSSLSGEELADLATQTDGFTGAELAALVDDARRRAADRDAEAIVRSDFPSIEELTERTESAEPDPADLLGGPEDMDGERTADSDPPDPDDRRLGYH